jgi:hypothetical protein
MRLHRGFTGIVLLSCAAIVAGCAKKESTPAPDTVAASTATSSTTTATTTTTSAGTVGAPISLADVAGTWNVRAVPTSGTDTSATEYTLTATGQPTGWKIKFKNGPTVDAKVTVSGDSIITDAGPYKSVRRKGVEVTTHGSYRKQGDQLVGTTTAHYKTKGADSVLVLTTTGTKAP